MEGEAIGINTAILPYAQGIGFAIPINMAKSILDQLITEGRVIRAWLGVVIQNLTPEMAEKFGLKEAEGALVADISPDSPAEKAGIKRGDVILKVDGVETPDIKTLQQTIRSHRPGDVVDVEIWRDGKVITLKVTLAELEESISALPVTEKIDLGLEVGEITPDLVDRYALREKSGVVIVGIKAGGPADDAGLRPGDVILEVNREEIKNLKDWEAAISEIEPGETVLLLISRAGQTYFVPLKAEEPQS